jgi:hypothetical protein
MSSETDCMAFYYLACAHATMCSTMKAMSTLHATNLESVMQEAYTLYLDRIYTTSGMSVEHVEQRAYMNETAMMLMLSMRSMPH